MTQVAIELPEDIANRLGPEAELSKVDLEGIVCTGLS
jgi:hypothetical protein